MEIAVRAKVLEVVPFVVMVIMEGCTIALTIWAKTVMSNYGMSPFVFVVYTNALASLILLPYSFLFHSDARITITQYLVFVGLDYSSPILVCAMGHLVPTFSFLLGIILRTIKLDLRNSSIQAKLVGTFITVAGAVFVTLYKGPVVRKSSALLHLEQHLFVFASSPEHWVIGGILLAGASFSVSIWNIIQLGTVKQYPHVMKVVSFYSLIGTVQCTIISLAIERDLSAWRLKLDMELLLIILTAIFGGVIRSRVQIWCMQLKGPLYVPMFKPFGIVYASFFGISFFGNSIYYGSISGAIIMGIGYYAHMLGQIRDDEMRQDREDKNRDTSEDKVPLLQDDSQV
ncbi:hypothetical protein CRG98_023424 [Punica granatum]|uniref:WAT1-related protein n=1 Tax=Punica granatum TaxID=22663 RepID=A0A2I0JIY9_PUNGR|nr:hypothetical protein CRG98_023424 [Punica granatum]